MSTLLISTCLITTFGAGLAVGSPAVTDKIASEELSPDESAFLMRELARIEPAARIRELSAFQERQLADGGGFFGLLPDQLTDAGSIPVPGDEQSMRQAVTFMTRQRATGLAGITEIAPDWALHFRGDGIPDPGVTRPEGFQLHFDITALKLILEALEDGTVSRDEAGALIALPSNQEMLRHRAALDYMPEPRVTDESLVDMITRAGSDDPLERIWCWVNPWNHFGYADLVMQADGYRRLVEQLDTHGDSLVRTALHHAANHAPPETEFEMHFALTIGWGIRGWVTERMAGLNIEHVKDNWHTLLGTMIEETYHALQVQICPTATGETALKIENLGHAELSNEPLNRLYEAITYTVLEGSANLACGPYTNPKLAGDVAAGKALIEEFVQTVVIQGEVEASDEIIARGLRNNGPFYALGWRMAGIVAEHDGTHGVGRLLQKGPVPFALHAQALSEQAGEPLLPVIVAQAIRDLESELP